MSSFQRSIVVSTLLIAGSAWPVSSEANHLAAPTDESRLEARHRLALAEEQRALVEEISEAACVVALGIDVEKHVGLVEKTRDRFDQVNVALRTGDPQLGLAGEEHYSKVIRALDAVDEAWANFRPAVDAVVTSGAVPQSAKETLFEGDISVLSALSELVSRIESAYADPAAVTIAAALTVDIAARQEMITQAIGKDVCLLVLGWNVEKHGKTLAEWISLIGASHWALKNGAPAMGIAPAPTPEIESALEAFWGRWAPQQDLAERVLAGETIDPKLLQDFFKTNVSLLGDLGKIVKLYEAL